MQNKIKKKYELFILGMKNQMFVISMPVYQGKSYPIFLETRFKRFIFTILFSSLVVIWEILTQVWFSIKKSYRIFF